MALSPAEQAVLGALRQAEGRVLSRTELARRAGLVELSPRRCDSILVSLRRNLGAGAILNVRGRGWRLAERSR